MSSVHLYSQDLNNSIQSGYPLEKQVPVDLAFRVVNKCVGEINVQDLWNE